MRFRQLDRILELEPGVQITAERTLSGRDTLFLDHFPQFPVLPGVLTLEAMFQACDWLVRKTDNFCRSVVLLKEVRGLKFAGFVQPGHTFKVTAHIRKLDDRLATLSARVTVEDQLVASSRLVLERFDLAERYPARAALDRYLSMEKLKQFRTLEPNAPESESVAPTSFRWMWIDRFTEFVRGQQAEAIKTVSLTDEPIDFYVPGLALMPCSLIIEGLAQAGGTLISEVRGFEESVVLGKVGKAVFHRPALAGDTMTYRTEVVDVQPEGAIVRGTSHIDDELHAEIQLSFAYLDDRLGGIDLIEPADLLRVLRLYGLYGVGVTGDGSPLQVPQRLLDAEERMLTSMGSMAEEDACFAPEPDRFILPYTDK
jgi:3-hydroxyacyl-[acyl-carrier-protein] dehydratase